MVSYGEDKGLVMWDVYIRDAEVFVIFYSEHWYESARGYLELEYAKKYKKPMRIFVRKGETVPEDVYEGVKDWKIKEVENDDEVIESLEKWDSQKIKAAIAGVEVRL